jgi:hypothetical protein
MNQAIKRNTIRFPDSFMFQLSEEEWNALMSQFVISNEGRGGRRKDLKTEASKFKILPLPFLKQHLRNS